MEAKMDLTMFKEIPGYKAILKAVLKAQMQMLVDQLSEAEEETVILTASLSDGTLSHLGSQPGKTFLDGREEIKSQFLFHCLKRKTSTPMPTPDPRFIAGQAGTTLPNQEPVFIPGGKGPAMTDQDQMFTDLRPRERIPQHDERPTKKARRTLPEIPSLFESEVPTQFGRERESQTEVFERGRGGTRGAPFGPRRGMGSPRGGPFGRGIIVGRGGSSRGGPVGRGLAVGRGSPSGRGAGSGRGRRARGQFTANRGRGRGVRKPSATITSADQDSVSSTADLDNINKTEPDLVTVKAENFEVSIDLNSPGTKQNDTPVNIDTSPSVKLKRLPNQSDSSKKASTPKKHSGNKNQKHGVDNSDIDYAIERNDSVGHDTDAFNESTDDDNDGTEALDSDAKIDTADSSVNDSNVDTADNSPNVSRLSIKQEVQDVEELLGMEAGSLHERYGGPGPGGKHGNQSWGIMESSAMGSGNFDGGTPGSSQQNEEGTQSPGNSEAIPPVYQYLDQCGNLKPELYRKKCAVKRKLSNKTIEEKYVTILEVEKGEMSKTEIARKHKLAQSTLAGWVKDSEAIKAAHGKFFSGRRKRARKGIFHELEVELATWCKSMIDKDVQLTGPIVFERVQQLKLKLGVKDCKPSSAWLERFKERHGIRFKKPQGSSKGSVSEPVNTCNDQELAYNDPKTGLNTTELADTAQEPAYNNPDEDLNTTNAEPARKKTPDSGLNTLEPISIATESICNNTIDTGLNTQEQGLSAQDLLAALQIQY